MYNSQAVELSRLSIQKARHDSLYIGFEPVEIKNKNFKKIKSDDKFLLHEDMPKTYIYQDRDIMGQAKLGTYEGKDMVVVEANEHIVPKSKNEKGFTRLYPRYAVISRSDFTVGNMIELVTKASRSILLYDNHMAVATASIMHSKKGYVLQIDQVL